MATEFPSRIPEDLLAVLLDRTARAPSPLPVDVVLIGTSMFDEEDTWHLVADVGEDGLERDREIGREQFDALQQAGVAVEALVCFPSEDEYGRPDEATPAGLLEWIEGEQGLVSCGANRFLGHFLDTGDDSPAECFVTILLPKGEAEKIFEALPNGDLASLSSYVDGFES